MTGRVEVGPQGRGAEASPRKESGSCCYAVVFIQGTLRMGGGEPYCSIYYFTEKAGSMEERKREQNGEGGNKELIDVHNAIVHVVFLINHSHLG